MRTTQLLEADFGDFSVDAASAVDSIAKYAGGAFGKFRSAYDKAKSDLEGESKEASEKNAAKKSDAKKAADKKPDVKNQRLANKEFSMKIPRLVAELALKRPAEEMKTGLPEFQNLTPAQVQLVFAAINRSKKRLAQYPIEMRKLLRQDVDFLGEKRHDVDALNIVLGKQPESTLKVAESIMQDDRFDELEAWADVMVIGDARAVSNMLEIIHKISADYRQSNTAAGEKKNPETWGVVKLLSSERQVLLNKLGLLYRSVEKSSRTPTEKPEQAEKPVTAEALINLRELLKQL